MYLPNYKDGSIVNLMSSICSSFGHTTRYSNLGILPPRAIESETIILMCYDGLGYHYIKEHGKFFKEKAKKITSVFPPTTASCVTTFATAEAPQQHAITGWFMHLRELGIVAAILPFNLRYMNYPIPSNARDVIFDRPLISDNIEAKSILIMPKKVVNPVAANDRNVMLVYETFEGFFRQIRKAITLPVRKFIYAYWPEFDSICHEHGTGSKEAKKHFLEIESKTKKFLKTIKQETVIITADHGLIDSRNIIDLDDHPKLAQCLTLPLCGEPRAAFCYVRPGKTKDFENYIHARLSTKCHMYKTDEIINQNFFGLFEANPKLAERIGDYVLVMKDNYVIRDRIIGEEEYNKIGHHGGVSKYEMFVPLIVHNPLL